MLGKYGAEEASKEDPSLHIIRSEISHQLQQILKRLPETWQEVVRLRIGQDLTFQQIATQLDIPLGTALTRMRRALERLKSEIDSDEDDDAQPTNK